MKESWIEKKVLVQNTLSLVGLRVGLQQDVELELLPPTPGRELEDLPQPREHHLGGGYCTHFCNPSMVTWGWVQALVPALAEALTRSS